MFSKQILRNSDNFSAAAAVPNSIHHVGLGQNSKAASLMRGLNGFLKQRELSE
jgi:hypothetical protein